MCFRRKKKKVKQAEPQKEVKVEEKKVEAVSEEKPAPAPNVAPEAETKVAATEPVKEEPKKEPSKPAPKEAPKKEETKEQANVKYHISQNKDEKSEFFNQWRVRRSGSDKTIKYFKTQKEAIDYAKTLAKNQDTDIVIHKKDGKIRKQKY